jgi:hypothetical protein
MLTIFSKSRLDEKGLRRPAKLVQALGPAPPITLAAAAEGTAPPGGATE